MNKTDIQTLFDETDNTKFLNIIKDNQMVELSLNQIFDATLFDEFYAVSYVSSPRFFSKTVKDFKKVQFVLGIPDSTILNDFASRIQDFFDIKKRIEFWNELNTKTKEKINSDIFQIKFAIPFGKFAVSVHSKIYLLKNSQNLNTRVIIGSANLTENAFIKKGQFEEIIIFDNSSIYELYFERFNLIFSKTVDYVPELVKKKDKTKIIHTTDAETLKEAFLNVVETARPSLLITEPELEQMKKAGYELIYEKDKIDRTNEILQVILQKKNDCYVVQSREKLIQKSVPIKTAICKTNKTSEDIDNRIHIQYIDNEDFLYSSPKEEKELQPFSEQINKEELIHSLSTINEFIEAYKLFTFNPDLRNQSKVFEIILFAFMSPFIWKVRTDYAMQEGRDSVKRYFQPFLIIGGKAGSGKTTILEFISMLLGGNTNERYLHYSKVDKSGIIYDYFHTENLYPILVDEVPMNFFKSTDQKKGEALIKYISNELSGKHPIFIATTNLTEFYVNPQVLTRVYYLEIDKVFDISKRAESSKYLNNLLSQVNNHLFKDFTYKIGKLIKDTQIFYTVEDMLCIARSIFRDYYKEAEMELPSWLPLNMFRDYEERGKRMWRNVFSAERQAFKINEEEGTIFVDMGEICEMRQKPLFINYLNPVCIQEEGAILVLIKKDFYHFIEHHEIDKNISEVKKQEIKKELITEIEEIETRDKEINQALEKELKRIVEKMEQEKASDREQLEKEKLLERQEVEKQRLKEREQNERERELERQKYSEELNNIRQLILEQKKPKETKTFWDKIKFWRKNIK